MERSSLLPNSAMKELELTLPQRRLIWEMHSGPFIELLETLSGCEQLLPDPHLLNAGLFTYSDESVQIPIGADLDRLGFENRLSLVTVLNAQSAVNLDELPIQIGSNQSELASITCQHGACVIFKSVEQSSIRVYRTDDEDGSSQQLLVVHYYQKSN